MRKTRKFTFYVNWGAFVLLIAAVVALLCTERRQAGENRGPASASAPSLPQ